MTVTAVGVVVEQEPEGEREAVALMLVVPVATPVTVVWLPGVPTVATEGEEELQEVEEVDPQVLVMVTLPERSAPSPTMRVMLAGEAVMVQVASPQLRLVPQPSGIDPQVTPWAAQVVGVQTVQAVVSLHSFKQVPPVQVEPALQEPYWGTQLQPKEEQVSRATLVQSVDRHQDPEHPSPSQVQPV